MPRLTACERCVRGGREAKAQPQKNLSSSFLARSYNSCTSRMSLAPGVRVGASEIVALLGSGGMGEVYRARDIKLERDVAIKVLPEAFATDSTRIACVLVAIVVSANPVAPSTVQHPVAERIP